jgi:hypothetical protein
MLEVQELVVLLERLPDQAVESTQGTLRDHIHQQKGGRGKERGIQEESGSSRIAVAEEETFNRGYYLMRRVIRVFIFKIFNQKI